jgi:hypothetical protein
MNLFGILIEKVWKRPTTLIDTWSKEEFIENYFLKICFPKFQYFNFPFIFSITLCLTLKSYEFIFFLCIISIYLTLILDWILSTHMLVVSTNAKHCPLYARTRVALSL